MAVIAPGMDADLKSMAQLLIRTTPTPSPSRTERCGTSERDVNGYGRAVLPVNTTSSKAQYEQCPRLFGSLRDWTGSMLECERFCFA